MKVRVWACRGTQKDDKPAMAPHIKCEDRVLGWLHWRCRFPWTPNTIALIPIKPYMGDVTPLYSPETWKRYTCWVILTHQIWSKVTAAPIRFSALTRSNVWLHHRFGCSELEFEVEPGKLRKTTDTHWTKSADTIMNRLKKTLLLWCQMGVQQLQQLILNTNKNRMTQTCLQHTIQCKPDAIKVWRTQTHPTIG